MNKPLVRAAVFCEMVDKDEAGRDCVIGISDAVLVQLVPGAPNVVRQKKWIYVLVECPPGQHTAILRYRSPRGLQKDGEGRASTEVGKNRPGGFRFAVESFVDIDVRDLPATYGLEILIDGKVIDTIPLHVTSVPLPTSPHTH